MSFSPTEIIFCPTSKCNLNCSHCFVKKDEQTLDIKEAQNFIAETVKNASSDIVSSKINIEKVGFSGGEPFLHLDFLSELSKTVVENNLFFDKIMTNGVWWKTENQLKQALKQVYDSGFDGKIGLSFDSFHEKSFNLKQDDTTSFVKKISIFIKAVFEIWENPTMIEIQSVVEECRLNESDNFLIKIEELANILNLEVINKTDKKTGFGIIWLNGESCIPIERTALSFLPTDKKSWKDKKWFKDDFCEATGQVLFVHSNGKIAPCCGFANEENALCIGKITDKISDVLSSAKANALVNICYNEGLNKYRKTQEKLGIIFPGKTLDMCMFCHYLCKKATPEEF